MSCIDDWVYITDKPSKAINERIKDLDYHECKVRVTNVDSQASDSNIVIQVIGEMSNNSPHKLTDTLFLTTSSDISATTRRNQRQRRFQRKDLAI